MTILRSAMQNYWSGNAGKLEKASRGSAMKGDRVFL